MAGPVIYNQDITITQGIDWPGITDVGYWVLSNASSAQPPVYTPYNLTGYAAAMKVRTTSYPLGSVVLSVVSPGNIVLGGTAGSIALSLPAALTSSITPGTYFYDLVLTSAAGKKLQFLAGKFLVLPLMTQ